MHVDKITSDYNPLFKARFADDRKTKAILKEFALESPFDIHVALKFIKKIKPDDTLALKTKSGRYTEGELKGLKYIDYYVKNSNNGQEINLKPDFTYIKEVAHSLADIISGNDKANHELLFGQKSVILRPAKQENVKKKFMEATKTTHLHTKIAKLDKLISDLENQYDDLQYQIQQLVFERAGYGYERNKAFQKYVFNEIDNI